MKYQVIAPNGLEVFIANGYNQQKFIHGTYMYSDELAAMYPNIFRPSIDQDRVTEDGSHLVELLTEVNPVEKVVTENKQKTEPKSRPKNKF